MSDELDDFFLGGGDEGAGEKVKINP